MKLSEFQREAMRFSPDGHDRIHYACLGLMGECGEIIDVIKKMSFRPEGEVGIGELTEELGDVMWYLAELATGLEIDLAAELCRKGFQNANYRKSNLESYAATMLSVALKCYTYGHVHRQREPLIAGMRKIYACIRLICQLCNIPMSAVLDGNIYKLKKRYPAT